ncbi:hypothetical protein AS96_12790 [Microbacterium sp. MRS-1]|nr:hypothetical protein AS96_12790 [Microbacterium sp. MRS-1]
MRLNPKQQHVMVVAMYVRNAMEDFHVKHLSDEQMAELNPIIRQALFDVITIIEDDDLDRQAYNMGLLANQIPPYWEVPDKPSFEQGKARRRYDQAA